jgi:hypothetical protein
MSGLAATQPVLFERATNSGTSGVLQDFAEPAANDQIFAGLQHPDPYDDGVFSSGQSGAGRTAAGARVEFYTPVTTGESNPNTTPIGIDDAGGLLITFGATGMPDLLNPVSNVLTPIALQGAPAGSSTEALAISANGTVLGASIFNTRTFFTQLGGTTTSVNLPLDFGFPERLNDTGLIIGSTFDGLANFLFNLNAGTGNTINAPGNLVGINGKGQILEIAVPRQNSGSTELHPFNNVTGLCASC